MSNPFNPEAGEVPAPTDPRDQALVEQSAKIIWRAFPYFAWRYGARGRSFGRSDAGYLMTLQSLDEAVARQQVTWLAGVLAPRGMPSVLLEYQLESLGRLQRRSGAPGENRFIALASELRAARLSALSTAVFAECERSCWAAARGLTQRRGAGFLIAAAVADRAIGLGEHDEALVRWLSEAEPVELPWSSACASARELAMSRCRDTRSAGP